VTFGSAGGRAVLDVEDRGGGVPQELRQKLFEPFVTAGKSGGTGLGLAIARQVVEAHGGEIELAASDEGGSTFRITLPLAMQDEPSRAAGDR
jgi:signal transduction histidine kinase